MTNAAKPHCDHANWRNHRPEDDIEVSGASHKPDCSVHYNDPKRLNCNCGLWEAAKPVSDDESCSQAKHAAEIVRRLRGYNTYDSTKMRHNTPQVCLEAADTIEALVQDNEWLQKIEQRAKDRLALHREYRNAYNQDIIETLREVIGEGDQLQGGSDK